MDPKNYIAIVCATFLFKYDDKPVMAVRMRSAKGLLRPLILPLTLPFSVNIHVTDDFIIQERMVYVHMMDGALKRP